MPTLREKSMLLAAKLLEKMNYQEAALGYYERFTVCYPLSEQYPSACLRLEALREG